jgi:ribosome-associated protein YbcJ (S4-like RNA binding protein)
VSDANAPTRSAVGRLSQLDSSGRARLEAACGLVNDEMDQVRGRIFKAGLGCAVLGVAAAVLVVQGGVMPPHFPLFVALALWLGYAGYQQSQLARAYKHVVIGRIVSALGQGLTYSPKARFTKDDFLGMDLFLQRVETWRAEDEITGRRNAVQYAMFEASATRTEGSGKNRRTVTIFKGMVVSLEFNKHFRGHTVVVPNSESQILGGLFGESESRRRKELCRMEDVEFEDTFSVYSTDQQEARYILTPKMMELIRSAHASFGAIRCSFQASSVFITIPTSTNRFEIRLWSGKMTPDKAIGELADCVDLAEQLVDALDLETRIWSKV